MVSHYVSVIYVFVSFDLSSLIAVHFSLYFTVLPTKKTEKVQYISGYKQKKLYKNENKNGQ